MKLIQKIKDKLGLSTIDIANYTDLSKSYVSMVTSNQRQLPSEANMALLELFTAIQNVSIAQPPTLKEQTDFQQAIQLLLQTEQTQQYVAEQALQHMQLKYQQATTLLAVAEAIQLTELNERAITCLNAFKAKAQKKLAENSWAEQQLLALKIKCHAYKIKEINKLKQ